MQSNRLVLASAIAVFALALVSLTSASLYAPSTGIYVASDYCVSPARPYRSYCSSGNAGLYGYACFSRNVKCCGCDYESGSTSYVCYGCDQGDSCPSMYYGQCYESTAPYGRSGLQRTLTQISHLDSFLYLTGARIIHLSPNMSYRWIRRHHPLRLNSRKSATERPRQIEKFIFLALVLPSNLTSWCSSLPCLHLVTLGSSHLAPRHRWMYVFQLLLASTLVSPLCTPGCTC